MEGGWKEGGCLWVGVGVGVGVDGTASTVVSRKGWRWVTMEMGYYVIAFIHMFQNFMRGQMFQKPFN